MVNIEETIFTTKVCSAFRKETRRLETFFGKLSCTMPASEHVLAHLLLSYPSLQQILVSSKTNKTYSETIRFISFTFHIMTH